MRRVLIADDEESIRHVLTELLSERGYEVRAVADGDEAARELAARDYDALVTDVRMPRLNGLDLIRAAQSTSPETTIIVMSAYGSHDLAIEALKAGAYDYLGKPFRPDEVLLVLRKAEERERLRRENLILRREMSRRAPQLVAEGPAMKEVLRVVHKVAPAPTTVLIEGESGTGKELIARALHDLSPRAERPFVAVNCGAIPAPLIESELFGHTKGAFTDARTAKRGLFEEADGGTLLLDEIGELPPPVQPALLRVLQQGEVRRVGDARSTRVDVRVLASTNRDLASQVQAGRFREDLYYRLNVVQVRLPPLRERQEEIGQLAERLIARHAERIGVASRRLSPRALELLQRYRWPGNVRELENALERALVLSEDDEIGPDALPDAVQRTLVPEPVPGSLDPDDLSVKRAQRVLEADLIRRALERTQGNRTRAAELLELSPRALLYKIREYGLE
ncbi:MAG: sigma-54-dependent Fis family transcriptional regulator [Deltaproteobacteria bacterium]|nr:MAG: sigma-54-dependent Fis family transcriptional regulator [Deltaproteobacteria bacterium]TMB34009.1 MAG: sigma-54-dependent Fis family transcriptional regulator [Deltaproteobacteria bacterium]